VYAPAAGSAPLDVSFTDSSTGMVTTRLWQFGDGTTDTAANPKHRYLTAGRFAVLLVVAGPGGADTADTAFVTVTYTKPVAKFSYSPSNGPAPLTVSFVDSSSGSITSRRWDFGDGATDTVANPKHVYKSAGRFPALLTVNGPGGADTTDTVFVTVVYTRPTANFSFSPSTGLTPLTVWFADSSKGAISARLWNFGDGKTDTSTNPIHVYPSAGVFTVTLTVTGPGGSDSLIKKDSVYVYSKGQNPLRIHAAYIHNSDVQVTISNINLVDTAAPPPVCDSIGIWVAPDTFPVQRDSATLLYVYPRSAIKGASIVDTLTLGTDDSVYGLMTALFWSDGTVTEFAPVNGDVVQMHDTVPFETALQEGIRMKSLRYDSTAGSIRVSWCIDSVKFTGDFDVGITYSLEKQVSAMTGTQVVIISTPCTDTIVRLNEPLRFDTLYHVGLFIRRAGGAWQPCTDSSRGSVKTGAAFRQVVTLFNPKSTRDTVVAFNDRVQLWKDSTYGDVSIVDTLETVRVTPPAGCTIVGTPFKFVKASSGPFFYVGIMVGDLPAGTTISDVGIYRDSAGVITAEYASRVGPAGVVYVRTRDLGRPFIAMIDRQPPVVTFVRPSDTIAYTDRDIVDSVSIVDNIANVRWSYLYGKGDEKPVVRDSGEFRATTNLHQLSVSKDARAISSETGVRAWLIIYDGAHRDTVDLSRQVFREKSDEAVTGAEEWRPVYPTGRMYRDNPDSLVPYVNKETGSYDKRYIRMYRWVETDANRTNDTSKWVEYDPADEAKRSLFTLQPGRLFWLKAKDNVQFDLGAARTLSLKDTFTLDLPPRQFIDFGMPLRFGVYLKDIISASGQRADSIRYYVWKQDTVDNRYFLEPMYIATMPDKKDPAARLDFAQRDGYSLFNPTASTVTLRIPALPVAMSAPAGEVKKQKEAAWGARLLVRRAAGGAVQQVYLGYAPGIAKSNFPVLPSFLPIRAAIVDRGSGKYAGDYIAEDAGQGLDRELLFSNSSDSAMRIDYSFETVGTFPESYSAYLFDAATGSFTSNGSITLEPHSTVSRWCSIGDESWHSRFNAQVSQYAYGLRRIYPNPARSMVSIGFTVPMSAQERLTLVIFDLHGRKVWERRLTGLLSAGHHVVTWTGRDRRGTMVGAGMYLVRMTVTGAGGAVLKQFDQRLTFMP
jgi:PKD repeat protein